MFNISSGEHNLMMNNFDYFRFFPIKKDLHPCNKPKQVLLQAAHRRLTQCQEDTLAIHLVERTRTRQVYSVRAIL